MTHPENDSPPQQTWWKLGCIWTTTPQSEWMVSHASNPVAEHLDGSIFRVYFSCRDANNVSSIAYFEFDINHPLEILRVSPEPVLGPGSLGAFDDSGVSIGCLVRKGNQRYLYYMGWNLGVTVPWRNSIGLAVSDSPDAPFIKYSSAPILDRNEFDPYTISYPWVYHDAPQARWQMWYGSNLKWGRDKQDMDHVLKYAESQDGIHWQPTGEVILPFRHGQEYAQARPTVLIEKGIYKMWFAFRGEQYRIGYAESRDGRSWNRKDAQAGIDVSTEGWDSRMLCYPCVFEHQGRKYLLYNGNDYGKSGIGLAVASKSSEI
jgi:hypothetical protein